MSAGCLVIGSSTAPVMEVLRDGENGLAVDFFAIDQLCDLVEEVLNHPDRMQTLRDAARATAIRDFDLRTVTLPRWEALLDTLAHGRFPDGLPPELGLATELGLR